MTKNFTKLKKYLPALMLIGFFALSLAPLALAQSNFNPPSVLPGDDSNIGGYGDACIGLANMIREGTLSLRQIPCFIKYFTQTLIAIAGSLSVIFVMIGGYRYVIEATDDSRAEAKRTITYALIGLAVSLLAWILVDIVLQLATE
jgi:hypothetical protein